MHLRAPIGAEHAGIRELLVESGLPTDDLDSAAIEFILAAQGKLDAAFAPYLEAR